MDLSTQYKIRSNPNYIKFFVENLRKYKGENISPSTFNPYIDKASNKSRIYKIYNN